MEPANLKAHSPDDAQIEAWLHANSARAPLPDNGFSSRVLGALPARLSHRKSSLRGWLLGAGALLGCVFAASSGGIGPGVADGFATLIPAVRAGFAPLADPSMALAIAVTAGSLIVVYWRELASKLAR